MAPAPHAPDDAEMDVEVGAVDGDVAGGPAVARPTNGPDAVVGARVGDTPPTVVALPTVPETVAQRDAVAAARLASGDTPVAVTPSALVVPRRLASKVPGAPTTGRLEVDAVAATSAAEAAQITAGLALDQAPLGLPGVDGTGLREEVAPEVRRVVAAIPVLARPTVAGTPPETVGLEAPGLSAMETPATATVTVARPTEDVAAVA